MKTRIVLSSFLIVVLLSSLFVPLAAAQGPATDDVGADQQPTQWTKRPVYLTLDPAPAVSAPAAPWKPDAPVTLVLDDGTTENYLGVGDGVDNIQFIWLNRFTPDPADFPFDLQEISVIFGSTGVVVGDPVQLLVYEDTDGDGDPTNASLVAAINETIQITGGTNWNNYTLATPVTLNGPGDVLIGVINRYQLGVGLDYPAAIDQTVSQYRSWAGWWNTDIAPDPPYLPPDAAWGIIDDWGFAGNWMVRGAGETGGVEEPDIYVDPEELMETLCIDEIRTVTLEICNAGTAPLEWTVTEVEPDQKTEILWDNGPLVTNPGGGYGGADLSALQTALLLNTYGFGNQFIYSYRMADDFEVDTEWTVEQITFYAYQTGSPTDPSPITGLYYQIWDGVPDDPGSSVVFGDLVTNRLADTYWSGAYRAVDYDPMASNRPIMADVAAGGAVLPPGTYWLDWLTDGSLSSGPWAPPISILGEITTGNALQNTGVWAPALDTGTSTQQGMPFVIEGERGGTGDIPWLSEDPVEGTVDPGDCQAVDVTFDATGLAPDVYTGDLLIESNDPDQPELTVPVEMTVEECGELTMHVQAISGWFFRDPHGFPILRALVQAVDQDEMPLSGVLIDATISVPGKDDAMRSRYTHPNGWARFWAPAFPHGTYELCVDNLTLEGYVYNEGDNVVTCMEWER